MSSTDTTSIVLSQKTQKACWKNRWRATLQRSRARADIEAKLNRPRGRRVGVRRFRAAGGVTLREARLSQTATCPSKFLAVGRVMPVLRPCAPRINPDLISNSQIILVWNLAAI